MEFSFAHLSDVHLGPLPPGAMWRDFALKRVIGGLSWAWRRRYIHDPHVADVLAADIQSKKPDHVAFTGDILNIAALAEFPRAAAWMEKLGAASDVSFTPGNHDAYVAVPFQQGPSLFVPFMTGDTQSAAGTQTFPYVRLRRNVAFIGLNSGIPQSLVRAGGTLGSQQLNSLAEHLKRLKVRGFYRVVMLHHPPLPGLATARKALTDAAALQRVLSEQGAELVLHGHNHRQMFNSLASATGTIHVHGVPSASSRGHGDTPPAAWHLYTISRSKGRWRTQVSVRTYAAQDQQFHATQELELLPDAPAV